MVTFLANMLCLRRFHVSSSKKLSRRRETARHFILFRNVIIHTCKSYKTLSNYHFRNEHNAFLYSLFRLIVMTISVNLFHV